MYQNLLGIGIKKIALALIGLSVATAGYCGVGESTGNTTCYIYKDNKLTQTVKCKYNSTEGSSSSYSFRHITYTAKAFGKIETASDYDEAGDVITLNSKPAIEQYRHPKTKKIVSDEYAQSGKETLGCYKNIKTKFEFCS